MRPIWLTRTRPKSWNPDMRASEFRLEALESSSIVMKRSIRAWCSLRITVIASMIVLFLGSLAGLSYITLVRALIHRLTPSTLRDGLQDIVANWEEPDTNGAYQFEWRDDFSRGVVPKNCHSHNDYWREAPVYSALAAGCTGIEADVWLMDDGELRVSHTLRSIALERTLRNLYLDPLTTIFTQRNVSLASTETREVGVFDADPNLSITLLIDFKNNGGIRQGENIWPVLLSQLQPLRDAGWLTYYNGTTLISGPLTIVATGNAPFNLIQAQTPDRFIFYDAPLDDIANPTYDSTNSYYSSVQLQKAVGTLWFKKLSSSQVDILKTQIQAAEEKGLKSRYWGTPDWPISARNRVWSTLTEIGVGMLNVDDLEGATRWDWNWCVIAGLNLCGGS